MKKLTTSIFVALLTLGTVQSYAQDLAKAVREGSRLENKVIHQEKSQDDGSQVSPLSKDAFYGDFGKVGVANWSHKDQLDEVAFVNNGVHTTAFYGFDSKLIGSTVNKSFADLPAAAQKSIVKYYKNKGYQIGAVILFDDNENNDGEALLYGSQFTGEDHYFVTIAKGGQESVLLVKPGSGQVSFFQDVR